MKVEEYLNSHGITYKVHLHPPVFTCEELAKYSLPGLACKNLFLRDQKKRRYFLVILPTATKMDMTQLATALGEKKLSFVNPDTLMEKLGVEPGAVSPFGLMNNAANDVELFIEREVWEAPQVHFHPNRNTASLELTRQMFRLYLDLIRKTVTLI